MGMLAEMMCLLFMAPQDGSPVRFEVSAVHGDTGLSEYLSARAQETWPQRNDFGEGIKVTVNVMLDGSLAVRIEEGDVLLASRDIEAADPGAAKLTVWLLVRSTIQRALLGADEPGPAAEVVTSTEPRPQESGQWTLSALAVAAGDGGELYSMGPAVSATWSEGALAFSGELGYRLTPGVPGLVIHYLPLRVGAGFATGAWQLGWVVAGELKASVAAGEERWVMGAQTGPYAQLSLPLAPHAGLLVRGEVVARLVRQRFVLASGVVREQPMAAALAGGVYWQ
ncbi:MAG: hypothetical protein HYZ27_08280 [Deltaproteobacteria bacterium]|nr:hypothetical protein [Deltaproteobacteria bacterium]